MARLARAVVPGIDDELPAAMRIHESTRRPLASQPFVEKLEPLLSRKACDGEAQQSLVLPGNPGRPKKRRKQYGVPGIGVPGIRNPGIPGLMCDVRADEEEMTTPRWET